MLFLFTIWSILFCYVVTPTSSLFFFSGDKDNNVTESDGESKYRKNKLNEIAWIFLKVFKKQCLFFFFFFKRSTNWIMSKFLENLSTLLILFCVFSVSAGHPEEEEGDAKEKLLLTVVKIEQEYAHLSWFSNVPSQPGLVKCEVVCRPENEESQATEIKNSLPTNWTLLELPELHNNTKYSVFIVCSLDREVYRSNVVNFVTGVHLTTQLDKKVFRESHRHQNFPVPEAIHESQVTDVVLGVLSGVLGAIITFTSAFYLWKKYQRRQRVLRFYREATEIETNPFGVIQVYFDDATTNSNIGAD